MREHGCATPSASSVAGRFRRGDSSHRASPEQPTTWASPATTRD